MLMVLIAWKELIMMEIMGGGDGEGGGGDGGGGGGHGGGDGGGDDPALW